MDIRTRTRLGTIKILMLKGEKGDRGADGTSGDYAGLTNKPQINGTELNGNKTSDDLSLASASQLASVESDVSELLTDVGTLQSDVSDLQSDVSGHTTDISALQSRATSLESRATNLESRVTALETIETITPTLTRTSGGTGTVTARKVGRLVTLTVSVVYGTAVAAGGNLFVGTLGNYKPVITASGSSYYGSHSIVCTISAAGTVTVRNASSSDVTASSTANISVTYLTND